MKDLFDMIVESPMRALAYVLMLALFGVFGIIAKRLFARFTAHETQMSVFGSSIEHHSRETRNALFNHSEHLGKATKAINGDVLKIQKDFLSLKSDLLTQTSALEKYARELEHRTVSLATVFDHNIERFDEKLGHIVNLKKEIQTAYGKIEKLEENGGEFRILMGKHAKRLDDFRIILKSHDDTLKGKK